MLGKNIAYLRHKKGLSQRALAKQLNISYAALGMYETGRRQPDLDTLDRIASYFDVDISYLLTGKLSADIDPLLERIRQLSPESRIELEKFTELLELKEKQEGESDIRSGKSVI